MFAVDRQQRGAMTAHRLHEQVAGHHQRFLVRQQHALAVARRGQRRQQAGRADNGRHDVLNAVQRRDPGQAVGA